MYPTTSLFGNPFTFRNCFFVNIYIDQLDLYVTGKSCLLKL